MLILTRKIGESVVIGDLIYCTVLSMRDGQIRLGFDAPESVVINRQEIQQRIEREREQVPCANDELIEIDDSIIDRLIARFKSQSNHLATH